MGYTLRKYPVMEIAVSCEYGGTLESGHKRKRVGDIIAVRPPSNGIGRKEGSRYLWFRAEGLEENEFGLLTQPLYRVPFDATNPAASRDVETENKRRFKIDLERLVALYPWVDLARVADPNDWYQPLLPLDEDGLLIVDEPVHVLDIEELTYDRQTSDYLDPDNLREVRGG